MHTYLPNCTQRIHACIHAYLHTALHACLWCRRCVRIPRPPPCEKIGTSLQTYTKTYFPYLLLHAYLHVSLHASGNIRTNVRSGTGTYAVPILLLAFIECEVIEVRAGAILTLLVLFASGNSHHKKGRHSGACAPGDADPGSCQKHARALNTEPVWIPADSGRRCAHAVLPSLFTTGRECAEPLFLWNIG